MWVLANDSYTCAYDYIPDYYSYKHYDCDQHGTFNQYKSSTFRSNKTDFFIKYGDTTFASGTYGRDTISIGNLTIPNASFGLGKKSNSSIGVLGIGLPGAENTYAVSVDFPSTETNKTARMISAFNKLQHNSSFYEYKNLPVMMKQTGAIDYTSYALSLPSKGSGNGSLLFGAIDHSKYDGSLYTIPLVNTYEEYGMPEILEFDVTLYGIGIQDNKKEKQQPIATSNIPALLDSGTTYTYLPKSMLHDLVSTIDISYDTSLYGFYYVRCSQLEKQNIVFDFGGVHISIPAKNFIETEDIEDKCSLSLLATSSNATILGESFLRSVYVVYDLEKLEISLAEASTEDLPSNIERLTTGVPNATIPTMPSGSSLVKKGTYQEGGNIFTLDGESTATTTSSQKHKNAAHHQFRNPLLHSSFIVMLLSMLF